MMTLIRQYALHAVMGLALGITLAQIGFADYVELHKMLSLSDFRMLGSFMLAVILVTIAFLSMSRRFPLQKKPFHPGIIPGSMLFGIGWAVSGACPAIVFVQLGQGKLPALMTMLGIFLGVKLYRYIHAKYLRWDTGSCGI